MSFYETDGKTIPDGAAYRAHDRYLQAGQGIYAAIRQACSSSPPAASSSRCYSRYARQAVMARRRFVSAKGKYRYGKCLRPQRLIAAARYRPIPASTSVRCQGYRHSRSWFE